MALDDAAGTLDLRRGPKTDGPIPRRSCRAAYVSTTPLRESLLRIGEWVAEHGIGGAGEYAAARRLLLRSAPAGAGADGEPLCRPDEDALEAALRIAPRPWTASFLAVQGPPGSGKTYLGAATIVELVRLGRTGRRHGQQPPGRSATCWTRWRSVRAERGVAVCGSARRRTRPATAPPTRRSRTEPTTPLLTAIDAGQLDVVGGTAWLWSRPEFAGRGGCARRGRGGPVLARKRGGRARRAAANLVLLGDPQQLDQPLQGTHPPGAEASALGHVLAGDSTMPPDRGLFLERTRRLHPDLCRFTSEAFYEGRLSALPGLENQDLAGPGALAGTGVRFVPVLHEGNRSESPEEADVVADSCAGSWTAGPPGSRRTEATRRSSWEDVLVVAPYNAQVAEIGRRLPAARVGTVDKFQGQEAPVSIYSMTTSGPEEAPRGMEFLYSLNRLNVATSRARCLAAVVASPALVRVRAKTPRQMRLANALCRFMELAAEQAGSEDAKEGRGLR